MRWVKISICNKSGFDLVLDGKPILKFGSIQSSDLCEIIQSDATGQYIVRGNPRHGVYCKLSFRLLGSGPANGRHADDGIFIIAREDADDSTNVIVESGCHYAKVYPGVNNDGRFYGNFNHTYRLEPADSATDAIVSEARILIEPPSAPNRFIIVSDIHCETGIADSPAEKLAERLHTRIALEQARFLGAVTVGDMFVPGDDCNTVVRNQRLATRLFSQQEYCHSPGMEQRSALPCPAYHGVGNLDEWWDPHDRIAAHSLSFEPRRWQAGALGSCYSWDWCGIRFIQLHAWPGLGKSSPDWPERDQPSFRCESRDSLRFLLRELHGSGHNDGLFRTKRPYVLLFHLGLRYNRANNRHWGEADKTRFYDAVADHPPQCIFTSHDHSAMPEAYRWRPENRNGEMLLVYNTAGETKDPCYWLVRLEGNTVVPVRAEYASGREVDLTSIFDNEQADFLSASS